MLQRSRKGRARSARSGRAGRILIASTAAAAGLVGVAGQHAAHGATVGPRQAYEVPTIADTNYPIPAGALYVAVGGSDSNTGTLTSPYASIHKAISVAPAGSTIVVRGGVYRESLGAIKRKVTIQAYPHEQPWVKGSIVAPALFTPGLDGWSTPFTASMCDTCYPSQPLAANYPAAGLPEQVFVDGAPLQQVTQAAALAPGTFWVDRANGRIVLHDDPTLHTVEVTVLGSAFTISSLASGTTIRGIGFEHYAAVNQTGQGSPNAFGITSASGVTFDSDTFAWSASRAIGLYGANNVVTNSKFLDNGMNGLAGNSVSGLQFENNEVAYSNYEHWDITPSPYAVIGGVKLTGAVNTLMRNNDFHDNYSNGLWFDVLSHSQTIVGNRVEYNSGHGIAIERCGHSIVAGNVIAENSRDGLKLSGANDVQVWNNTVVDNGWAQLGVYDDPRHTQGPATSNTTSVRIENNIVEAGANATNYVFYNLDTSKPKHLTLTMMVSADDHNDWGRTNPQSPQYEFSTQATLAKTARYLGLAQFVAASGRERASSSTDGMSLQSIFNDPDNGDYTPLPSALSRMAVPAKLPLAVAAAMGTSGTPARIGAI